jgi:hypothetical protein
VTERRLLATYLNDHMAGATAGVELARRTRASNQGTRWGPPLEKICAEIEADRATLGQVMQYLGVRRDPAKAAGAWAAEKIGRLKPNGRLWTYSPLSRLIELEMLHIGITGKLGLWRALQEALGAKLSSFDLPGLVERAESQRQTIERLRLDAATEAFAEERSGSTEGTSARVAGGG